LKYVDGLLLLLLLYADVADASCPTSLS